MKNRFAPMFRSVLEFVRAIPRTHKEVRSQKSEARIKSNPSRANPSRDRKGAVNAVKMPSSLENPLSLSPEQFRRMLAENHDNITRTAESLGLKRSHLYRKMKSLGIALNG